jgi:hypothetical protein
MIESALQPGHFIAWNHESAFVADLEGVEREIAAMVANDPQRASGLYETFIAACFLKAEQIDSEWEFGRFVGELACGWIRARQAAEASAESTGRTLLSWMDHDDYGFFNDLGSDAAKVLDGSGLAAFEKEVRGRFEEDCRKQKDQSGGYLHNRWAQILRSIYAQKDSVDEYLAVAERTRLTPPDCATVASMFEARRRLVALESFHQFAPPANSCLSVQNQPRATENESQKIGQRCRNCPELREDQRLLLAFRKFLADFPQSLEFATVLRVIAVVAGPLRRMIADLLQAHEKCEHNPTPLDSVSLLNGGGQFSHCLFIKSGLLTAQSAESVHFSLLREIGDHALVGLQTAQHVGLDQRA